MWPSGWEIVFQVASIVFVLLAAGSGFMAWRAGKASAELDRRELELRLAEQQERAANAEKELLALQQRIQPREITSEQEAKLTALLRAAPKGPVVVKYVANDGEGALFASRIVDILKGAGWEVTSFNAVLSTGAMIDTVFLVKDTGEIPPFAEALLSAFAQAGVAVQGVKDPGISEGVVEIRIGNKP